MASTRGKLAQKDFDCIRENFVYLKENLEARDIVDYLFQCQVVTLDEKIKISNTKTKPERNDMLLNILLHAGPGTSFNHFLTSLKGKYQHVLDRLLQPIKDPVKKRENQWTTSAEIDEQQAKPSSSKKAKTVADEIKEIQDETHKPEVQVKKRQYRKKTGENGGEQQTKQPRSKSAKKMAEELKAKEDLILQLKKENEKMAEELKAKEDQICQLKKENEKTITEMKLKYDDELCGLKKELEMASMEMKPKYDDEICQLNKERALAFDPIKLKDHNIPLHKPQNALDLIKLKDQNIPLHKPENEYSLELAKPKDQDIPKHQPDNAQAIKDMETKNAEIVNIKKEIEKPTLNPNEDVKKKVKKTLRLVEQKEFQKCVEYVLRKRGTDQAGIKEFWMEKWLMKSAEKQPDNALTSKDKTQNSEFSLNRIDLLKAKYKSWSIKLHHHQTVLKKEIKRYFEDIQLVLNIGECRSFWKMYNECVVLAMD